MLWIRLCDDFRLSSLECVCCVFVHVLGLLFFLPEYNETKGNKSENENQIIRNKKKQQIKQMKDFQFSIANYRNINTKIYTSIILLCYYLQHSTKVLLLQSKTTRTQDTNKR